MVEYLSEFIALVGIYIASGRKGAVPIGIALYGSWWLVFIYLLIIECAQIPLFYFLLGPVASRLSWIQKVKHRYHRQKARIMQGKLFQYARTYGAWGVFLVVVMPAFTGGVLGGILLARLLKLSLQKSIIAILCGILVCEAGLIFGVEGIKKLSLFFF